MSFFWFELLKFRGCEGMLFGHLSALLFLRLTAMRSSDILLEIFGQGCFQQQRHGLFNLGEVMHSQFSRLTFEKDATYLFNYFL